MPELFYYSNDGRGKGIARIISSDDDGILFEYKSSPTAKRWHMVRLSKTAFDRSGWKQRKSREVQP